MKKAMLALFGLAFLAITLLAAATPARPNGQACIAPLKWKLMIP